MPALKGHAAQELGLWEEDKLLLSFEDIRYNQPYPNVSASWGSLVGYGKENLKSTWK